MSDIPHDAMHGAGEVDLILVVHGHTDEELGLSHCRSNILTELVSFQHKVVRVAGHGRISHVSELSFVSSRKKAVEDGGDLAFQDQFAIDETDFLLCHLCLSSPSSALSAFWRRAIEIHLF